MKDPVTGKFYSTESEASNTVNLDMKFAKILLTELENAKDVISLPYSSVDSLYSKEALLEAKAIFEGLQSQLLGCYKSSEWLKKYEKMLKEIE